jgi:hypothetical protein
MTHAEFKELAHHLGADVVFETAPVAVFSQGGVTVSVEVSQDELSNIPRLNITDILATASLMTEKTFRGD